MTLWEDKNIDYEFADLIHEKQEGQRVKIKKHIIHPNYNKHKDGLSLFEYDIAIVITENIGEFINFWVFITQSNILLLQNNFC